MPQTENRPRQRKPKLLPASNAGKNPTFLVVARIRRPFGVKGELLLEVSPDLPNRLMQDERLYVGADRRPYDVDTVRRHGQDMLLLLKEIRDRDAAEGLRGEALYTRVDDLPPLPKGVYYLHQIEGLEVFTEQGERLGKVKEILKTGANDVYVVQGDKAEILLPAIPQVIREVQLEEGKIIVRLMEGLV
jgi:16S rRNA processing protein RimM